MLGAPPEGLGLGAGGFGAGEGFGAGTSLSPVQHRVVSDCLAVQLKYFMKQKLKSFAFRHCSVGLVLDLHQVDPLPHHEE